MSFHHNYQDQFNILDTHQHFGMQAQFAALIDFTRSRIHKQAITQNNNLSTTYAD